MIRFGIDDRRRINALSRQAISFINEELFKMNLKLESSARNFYREHLIKIFIEERSLLSSYLMSPNELEDDIKAFVDNIIKVRKESEISIKQVDKGQLIKAFAKCGPHRIRC